MFTDPGPEIQAVADMLQGRADALQVHQDGGHRELLEFARGEVLQTFERSFFQSVDPDGQKWRSLAYRRASRVHPILILSDTLRTETETTIRSTQPSHDELNIVCPTDYGAIHQFGYPPRNVPQRMFLGMNDENLQAIYDHGAEEIVDIFLGGKP